MKAIISIQNTEVADMVRKAIKKVLPRMKVDIAESSADTYVRGVKYDYAFISEDGEGMPWTELMQHLSEKGVDVYFVAEVPDKNILKQVNLAGGLTAISYNTILQDIEDMFIGLSDDERFNESEDDDENISSNIFDRNITFDEFNSLRLARYPAVIVSVHGARGGVGRSSIVANLGVSLAKMGLKTIVVDFDVENGNLANILSVETENDLLSIFKGNFNLSDDVFDQHSSGLHVLPGLSTPAESEIITSEACERIIGRLARVYDVVIIDTGVLAIDPMLVAMQISTKSYYVATCDLSVLASTYRMFNDAKSVGINTEKIKLILNRVPSKLPLDLSYVSSRLPIELLSKLPEETSFLEVANSGEVAYDSDKCKKFNSAINEISKDVLESPLLSEKLNALKEQGKLRKGGKDK